MKAKKTNGHAHGSITVESGIPMPPKKVGTGVIAAMRQMKVGDSFVYPGKSPSNCYGSFVYPGKSPSNCYGPAARAGITIATRKEGKGFRVWRTA